MCETLERKTNEASLYFTATDWFPCLIHCRTKWVENSICWGNSRLEIDGRNYGSCLQTSACFSTRRTRFVFMELANAENSWLSTYSGFLFFSNHLRFCFRSKMSANDKRDYTCMTKLVSLIVVQSSGEWCRNEICRFLFWYFRNICDSCMRAVWRCRHIPCDFCLRFQSWT